MNSTYRSQVLPLVQADNADMMVKNMVMIMTRVSETDLVLHLLWIPNIIYRKELEEMSEMSDDDYKYVDGDGDKDGDRLGICQKIYTTQFSGERILHTENA